MGTFFLPVAHVGYVRKGGTIAGCCFFRILNETEVLSEYQYGFMPGRPNQLAISDIFEATKSKLIYRMVISRHKESI